MSTKRRPGPDDALPACVAFYLATGTLPPAGEGPHDGEFSAFMLKGKWLHARHRESLRVRVLAELEALWREHRAEIEAAAVDEVPWVARVLEGDADDD